MTEEQPNPAEQRPTDDDQAPEGQETASPEDFEDDPARNPSEEILKDIKGG